MRGNNENHRTTKDTHVSDIPQRQPKGTQVQGEHIRAITGNDARSPADDFTIRIY